MKGDFQLFPLNSFTLVYFQLLLLYQAVTLEGCISCFNRSVLLPCRREYDQHFWRFRNREWSNEHRGWILLKDLLQLCNHCRRYGEAEIAALSASREPNYYIFVSSCELDYYSL